VVRTILLVSAGLTALAHAAACAAQAQAAAPAMQVAAQSKRATSYDAAFFKQYAPRTALDVAKRVPGFSLDLGDNSVRGFSGAAGNVVVNGQRPSNKSETLDQTLSRIPADEVVRAEVGPGDLYGADYAARSQVLNLILRAGSGVEGNLTASVRRFPDRGLLVPDGNASIVLHRGPSEFTLSGGFNQTDTIENGRDDVISLPGGSITERRYKVNHYPQRQPFVALAWALGSAPDRSVHVNARIQHNTFGVYQTNHVVPSIGDTHDDLFNQFYFEHVNELGGDIARPLAGGAIKLVALATRRNRNYEDVYTGGAPALGGFHQVQLARQAETLGRLSWSRSNLAGFSLEAGVESAYNSLDNRLRFAVVNPDGSESNVHLPIENAKVTERRGEAYVSVGRAITSSLHVDAGLRVETSTLNVQGDAKAHRSLRFWKPNLAFDWNAKGWHARLSLRRTVAQLNFFDFVSAADVSAGRINGGNAELVPQQSWESRFTLDHPVLGKGLVKLDLGYDRVNQLQDRILTDAGFDAPGNLGTGTRAFASFNVDVPLDHVGIGGGRLTASGTLQRTRVMDPSTGRMRNWTDFWPNWQWEVDYRQDLGRFSYGATLQDRGRFAFYRTDEIDQQWNEGVYGTAFVEYRPNAKTTVTFDVDNLFDTRALRYRTFFSPNRTNPSPSGAEFRPRNRHVNVGLTVKRTL
jgi:hypothetical protein